MPEVKLTKITSFLSLGVPNFLATGSTSEIKVYWRDFKSFHLLSFIEDESSENLLIGEYRFDHILPYELILTCYYILHKLANDPFFTSVNQLKVGMNKRWDLLQKIFSGIKINKGIDLSLNELHNFVNNISSIIFRCTFEYKLWLKDEVNGFGFLTVDVSKIEFNHNWIEIYFRSFPDSENLSTVSSFTFNEEIQLKEHRIFCKGLFKNQWR